MLHNAPQRPFPSPNTPFSTMCIPSRFGGDVVRVVGAWGGVGSLASWPIPTDQSVGFDPPVTEAVDKVGESCVFLPRTVGVGG